MKFKGKVTPRKGVDEGTRMNWFDLIIKLLMTDLMTY
jgi:hypothetical protein